MKAKFSKAVMKSCANMCLSVYKNPAIERGAVSADVYQNPITKVQYITFAGSENPFNWFSNFYALKEADYFFEGKVHKGFLGAYRGLRSYVAGRLTHDPIIVTGHSLGGAMAVLMAAYLKYAGYEVKAVYTFGKPRVGDHDFCEYIDSLDIPFFRVVNDLDGVVSVPRIGFEHEGQSIVICKGEISTYEKARKLINYILGPIDFGKDHLIKNYVNVVSNVKVSKDED